MADYTYQTRLKMTEDWVAHVKEKAGHLSKNHDHPSNGWFARPYKGTVTGQRLKTLAFTLFKPLCP